MRTKEFKVLLIKTGIKQVELAHRLGLSPSHFSCIVNNYLRPTKSEAEAICSALGVKFKALFPRAEDTQEDRRTYKRRESRKQEVSMI